MKTDLEVYGVHLGDCGLPGSNTCVCGYADALKRERKKQRPDKTLVYIGSTAGALLVFFALAFRFMGHMTDAELTTWFVSALVMWKIVDKIKERM